MSDELKPCAHCARSGEIEKWEHADWTEWRVICDSCCSSTDWYVKPELAIAVWNARAEDKDNKPDMDMSKCVHMCPNADDAQVIQSAETDKLAPDCGVKLSDCGVDSCETAKQPIGQSAARETAETAETDAAKVHMCDFDDSREKLEADVREVFGYRIELPMVMRWLDRQKRITIREHQEGCKYKAKADELQERVDSLTAERDKLREKVARLRKRVVVLECDLAHKQKVCDVQRESFLKLEAENAELRRALDGASDALDAI